MFAPHGYCETKGGGNGGRENRRKLNPPVASTIVTVRQTAKDTRRAPEENPSPGQENPNHDQENPSHDQENPNHDQENPSPGREAGFAQQNHSTTTAYKPAPTCETISASSGNSPVSSFE